MKDVSEDTVTIPRAEYEALLDAREDLEDMLTVERALENPEEGVPAEYADRIIDGEVPLAVYRDWRGHTQSSLAKASGVNRVQIADIEAGRKSGSAATLKKLAGALDLTVDHLLLG